VDPSLDLTGVRSATGAALVGTTQYAVPAGATIVANTGSNTGAGTLASPFATVQHAIDVATTGSTIVLRQGTYHESVTIPSTKTLTIQSYPGEAVWFDGSTPVTNWAASGSIWEATGWNHVLDSSPTYTRGAPDGTSSGWQFVNSSYPMAAHPDQLWIGGVAQQQVSSLALVKAGTFYYDTTAKVLYTGTNPSAGARASDLIKAISVQSSGSVLRGFGVRKYAPSVPDMGTVVAKQGATTIENVAITDNATTGLSIGGAGNILRDVTAARNGLLGVHANYSDGLRVTNLVAYGNNAEHFNTSPVSGGLKVTRSRDVTVANGAFVKNIGPGIWMDESVYNMKIVNDDAIRNTGNGISIEISGTLVASNNLVVGNGSSGLKLNNISNAQVWNNTLINNKRNLDITQDARRQTNAGDAGHDPRQAFPDPTVPWITGPDSISNNVISGQTGNCMVCVEDYAHLLSAEQMRISANGNVYQRTSTSIPTWAAIWSRGAGDPAVYTSIGAYKAATGQDARSLALDVTPAVVAGGWQLTPEVSAQTGAIALPLPSNIATLVGQPASSVHIGAW
jgi:hypothetical protein